MAAENTDFWIATSTIGPVMFLAIGVLAIELVREGGLGWTRTWQKAEIVAFNLAFLGTLLATTTATLSLAWGENLLPPKALAVVIVVAFVAFWVSLVFHFKDVEDIERRANRRRSGDGTCPVVDGQDAMCQDQ